MAQVATTKKKNIICMQLEQWQYFQISTVASIFAICSSHSRGDICMACNAAKHTMTLASCDLLNIVSLSKAVIIRPRLPNWAIM